MFEMVTKFQRVVTAALATNYGGDDLFEQNMDLRLPTRVVKRNDEFSDQMEELGQKYRFSQEGFPKKTYADADSDPGSKNQLEDSESSSDETADKPANTRACLSNLDVEEILEDQKPVPSPAVDILKWLEDEYDSTRGFELGTFSSQLLPKIMMTQSEKWSSLAKGYISDVVVMVHKFILQLLQSVCPDGKMRTNLYSTLVEDLFEGYKLAIKHVNFLLNVEKKGTHTTQNHYFNDNLEKW